MKRILIILGAALLAVCAVATAVVLSAQGHDENTTPEPLAIGPANETDYAPVDWDAWLAENPDIVGWISIPGTNVDFPIVAAQKSDPTHYLSYDIHGNADYRGAIYLDADCEGHLTDAMNAVVAGHNCGDGELFSAIANYSDREFGEAHRRVFIQTPKGVYEYTVSCAEVVDGTEASKRIVFASRSDFEEYYAQRLEASTVVYDEEIPQTMITLYTCSYGSSNERTVVHLQRAH